MSHEAIDEFLHLLQNTSDAARESGPDQRWVADKLEEFREQRALPLWRATQAAKERDYRLGLVGLTNVGKSTLLGVLLGHPVAPTGNRPMTAATIEYQFDQSWRLVCFRGLVSQEHHLGSGEELGRHIEAVATERGSGSPVDWATALGPMNLLQSGLRIYDTPGFGASAAAATQDRDPSWARVLDARLHGVLFCISAGGGDYSIGSAEHERFCELRKTCACATVVVTKWTGDENDEREYEKRHRALFQDARFMFVNARRAERGSDDGIDELLGLISHSASMENRVRDCREALKKLWGDLDRGTRDRSMRIPWAESSLDRFTRLMTLESSSTLQS